jgi:hypothetical protein
LPTTATGSPTGEYLSGQHRLSARRFPPPWSVEKQSACYVVRDHDGQQLAYIYYEEEPGRRSAAKLLTKDDAPRIEANIAKLAELLRKGQTDVNAAFPTTKAPETTRRSSP